MIKIKKIKFDKYDVAALPFYLFWLINFLPKIIQLAFFVLYFILMTKYFGVKKNNSFFLFLQFIFLIIFAFSCLYNSIIGEHELKRIIAAFNTLIINFIAVGTYAVFSNTDILNKKNISKSCLFNLIIMIILNVIYLIQRRIKNYSFLGHTLFFDDWINGAYATRFFGFLDYANMVLFAVLLFYPLALRELKNTVMKLIFTLGLFVIIYTTNSRTGLVLFGIILISYLIFGTKTKMYCFVRRNKKTLIFLLVSMLVFVLPIIVRPVAIKINKLFTMREGSNSMRMFIYKISLVRMMDENPIFGIGVKDLLENYGYPYGSHSTYIGVFYKAGILGGMVYLLSIINMSIKTIKFKTNDYMQLVFKISIICLLMLMCLEDVDGTNWAIVLTYILLSQIERNRNDEKYIYYNHLL